MHVSLDLRPKMSLENLKLANIRQHATMSCSDAKKNSQI